MEHKDNNNSQPKEDIQVVPLDDEFSFHTLPLTTQFIFHVLRSHFQRSVQVLNLILKSPSEIEKFGKVKYHELTPLLACGIQIASGKTEYCSVCLHILKSVPNIDVKSTYQDQTVFQLLIPNPFSESICWTLLLSHDYDTLLPGNGKYVDRISQLDNILAWAAQNHSNEFISKILQKYDSWSPKVKIHGLYSFCCRKIRQTTSMINSISLSDTVESKSASNDSLLSSIVSTTTKSVGEHVVSAATSNILNLLLSDSISVLKQEIIHRHFSPIQVAAAYGNIEAIQLFLQKNISLVSLETGNLTPLMIASYFGHHHIVEFFLQNVPEKDISAFVNYTFPGTNFNALHFQLGAISEKFTHLLTWFPDIDWKPNVEVAEFLISKGTSLNLHDPDCIDLLIACPDASLFQRVICQVEEEILYRLAARCLKFQLIENFSILALTTGIQLSKPSSNVLKPTSNPTPLCPQWLKNVWASHDLPIQVVVSGPPHSGTSSLVNLLFSNSKIPSIGLFHAKKPQIVKNSSGPVTTGISSIDGSLAKIRWWDISSEFDIEIGYAHVMKSHFVVKLYTIDLTKFCLFTPHHSALRVRDDIKDFLRYMEPSANNGLRLYLVGTKIDLFYTGGLYSSELEQLKDKIFLFLDILSEICPEWTIHYSTVDLGSLGKKAPLFVKKDPLFRHDPDFLKFQLYSTAAHIQYCRQCPQYWKILGGGDLSKEIFALSPRHRSFQHRNVSSKRARRLSILRRGSISKQFERGLFSSSSSGIVSSAAQPSQTESPALSADLNSDTIGPLKHHKSKGSLRMSKKTSLRRAFFSKKNASKPEPRINSLSTPNLKSDTSVPSSVPSSSTGDLALSLSSTEPSPDPVDTTLTTETQSHPQSKHFIKPFEEIPPGINRYISLSDLLFPEHYDPETSSCLKFSHLEKTCGIIFPMFKKAFLVKKSHILKKLKPLNLIKYYDLLVYSTLIHECKNDDPDRHTYVFKNLNKRNEIWYYFNMMYSKTYSSFRVLTPQSVKTRMRSHFYVLKKMFSHFSKTDHQDIKPLTTDWVLSMIEKTIILKTPHQDHIRYCIPHLLPVKHNPVFRKQPFEGLPLLRFHFNCFPYHLSVKRLYFAFQMYFKEPEFYILFNGTEVDRAKPDPRFKNICYVRFHSRNFIQVDYSEHTIRILFNDYSLDIYDRVSDTSSSTIDEFARFLHHLLSQISEKCKHDHFDLFSSSEKKKSLSRRNSIQHFSSDSDPTSTTSTTIPTSANRANPTFAQISLPTQRQLSETLKNSQSLNTLDFQLESMFDNSAFNLTVEEIKQYIELFNENQISSREYTKFPLTTSSHTVVPLILSENRNIDIIFVGPLFTPFLPSWLSPPIKRKMNPCGILSNEMIVSFKDLFSILEPTSAFFQLIVQLEKSHIAANTYYFQVSEKAPSTPDIFNCSKSEYGKGITDLYQDFSRLGIGNYDTPILLIGHGFGCYVANALVNLCSSAKQDEFHHEMKFLPSMYIQPGYGPTKNPQFAASLGLRNNNYLPTQAFTAVKNAKIPTPYLLLKSEHHFSFPQVFPPKNEPHQGKYTIDSFQTQHTLVHSTEIVDSIISLLTSEEYPFKNITNSFIPSVHDPLFKKREKLLKDGSFVDTVNTLCSPHLLHTLPKASSSSFLDQFAHLSRLVVSVNTGSYCGIHSKIPFTQELFELLFHAHFSTA